MLGGEECRLIVDRLRHEGAEKLTWLDALHAHGARRDFYRAARAWPMRCMPSSAIA
jgi:hypothetical protein